ncbi:hypothetical protein F4777DRAFT_114924 [Nemania sp. FL0916]|nr:hypothetical protein F4777DRAFT_114924 [Nemania sp. FL0916]
MLVSKQPVQCHHIVRVVALGANIVIARHLFAECFHYPLLMLIAHVSIALVLEVITARNGDTSTQKPPQSWSSRLYHALFAAAVAIGLVFTYHSFLHNRNTTLGVMLLGLDWTTVFSRLVRWIRQDKQRQVDVPLSTATFSLCIILLLWNENLLVGKGIDFILVAIVCMTIARQLWVSGRVESPVNFGVVKVNAYSTGLAVCLPLAAFLLAVTGWYNRRDFQVPGRILWMLPISLITGPLSLASESTLKKLTSWLQERVQVQTRIDLSYGSSLFPLLVLAIVDSDNVLGEHRPSTTSGVQWLGYAIAFLATIDIAQMTSSTASNIGETSYTPIPGSRMQDEPMDDLKTPVFEDMEAMYPPEFPCARESAFLRHISLTWQAILGSLALFLFFHCTFSAPSVEPIRSWDLDIVIAWYDEPVDQVISTAQLALEIPDFAGRKIRTIVYNKGSLNETELAIKFPKESGLDIRRLENVGREGDTYLSHILDSEQNWASHTLFIQAEPHDPGYLQARLQDYLVRETGFLSLSHVRNFCPSCDACNDHSGWTEEGTVLREIFTRSNPHKTCQDISLTYRGQFVVSSRRMRQANHELLREMRTRVIEDDHFGYTLERSWGTIFRCPTISERCPTLLSGWIGNRAEKGDCQCLDS